MQTPSQQLYLFQVVEYRRFNRGEFICRQGEGANYFYIIIKGTVNMSVWPARRHILVVSLKTEMMLCRFTPPILMTTCELRADNVRTTTQDVSEDQSHTQDSHE
eukprot:2622508-Pyramimonas_sp.AAC.1